MIKRSKYQIQDDVSLNLTPLIDVVFLLLIFFMVTTTFKTEARLSIELPDANAQVVDNTDDEFLKVQIESSGAYFLNGRELARSDFDTLQRAISLWVKENNLALDAVVVLIYADGQAQHQRIVTAMEAVGEVGIKKVRIATNLYSTKGA